MSDGHTGAAVCRATALDEQAWIAEALAAPVPGRALRVWIYTKPAVVLGCSTGPDAAVAARSAAAGIEWCVRPSGGGAVLAGRWLLGASVIFPAQDPLIAASIPESFRWLGVAHAAWLRGLGIAVRAVASPAQSARDDLRWSCFGNSSRWEVEAQGRKIVGLAQARRRNGVLFSAGMLVEPPPWRLLCDVLGRPREDAIALSARTASCAELLGASVAAEDLAQSLAQALLQELVQ